MPTYSYACKDCDNAFDIQQAFSDDSLTVCPECGGALRKRYGSVGVVFKGSGFYRTDSRSNPVNGSKKPADSSSSAGGSAEKASSTDSGSSSTGDTASSSSSTGSGTKAANA